MVSAVPDAVTGFFPTFGIYPRLSIMETSNSTQELPT